MLEHWLKRRVLHLHVVVLCMQTWTNRLGTTNLNSHFTGRHHPQPAGQQQLCGSGGFCLHQRTQRTMERPDYSGHAVRRPWYKHTHTHSYKVRAYIWTVTLTTVVRECLFLSPLSLENDSDPDAVAKDLEGNREVGQSVYLWFHLTALCMLAFTLLNYFADIISVISVNLIIMQMIVIMSVEASHWVFGDQYKRL